MGSKLMSSCIPMQLVVGGQKTGLQESEVSSGLEKLGPDSHFGLTG